MRYLPVLFFSALAMAAPQAGYTTSSVAVPSPVPSNTTSAGVPSSNTTSSDPTPSNVTASGTGATGNVAVTWYAGWHGTTGFPLSNVSWKKYTHITYAFAQTTPDVTVISLSGSNPDLLPQFVSQAHANGVKALVSIGGWSGSRYWSSNVNSAENRKTFVQTVTSFAKNYNLDGLDFDWEYPNHQGVGCNVIDPADTANFLAFLQELRQDPVGKDLILTAATSITPFMGPDGTPSSDVAAFGNVLDWIAIMNYDLWGAWSATVGPNAPLDDSCAPASSQAGSATSAVQKWSVAGFPKSKIVLGVAGYGHSFQVGQASALKDGSSLALYPVFDKNSHPAGDSWDGAAGPDVCGVQQPAGGVVNFWGLIQKGFLNSDGTPKSGIAYVYDDCSQTPFVYDPTTQVMVSYDNAQSFAAKGQFIKSSGLKGFSLWEAGGDSNDILLNSIRGAVGF